MTVEDTDWQSKAVLDLVGRREPLIAFEKRRDSTKCFRKINLARE